MSEFAELLNNAAEHGPETAAVAVAGLGIRRVLGPSVAAIGDGLGEWTTIRWRNLLRLDEKVSRRLRDDDEEDQTVHPRVAKEILDEGSWIDNDLHQEYLAGLLVGARSKDGASDSQAYLARIVTGLTAQQVRLHYLMISTYAGYWDGAGDCPFPFNRKDHYRRHAVRIDVNDLTDKFPDFEQTAGGLLREGIVQDFGRPLVPGGTDDTYTSLIPTPLAFDLYLHALARPGKLGRQGLLLPREHLARISQTNPELAITYPRPEPEPLATAHVHDLGP